MGVKTRIAVLVFLALTSDCIFQEKDAYLEYTYFYKEALKSSKPAIEVDAHGRIHLLADILLFYAKEPGDQDIKDLEIMGRTTRHFQIGEAGVTEYDFQNLVGGSDHSMLLGPSTYSDELYAAVRDMNKYILYALGPDNWKKIRSVSTRIDDSYYFRSSWIAAHGGDIWLPFFEYKVYEYRIGGQYRNYRLLGGIQINDRRILKKGQPDTSSLHHRFYAYHSSLIRGTYYFTGDLTDDFPNEKLLALYRASRDSIQPEIIRSGPQNFFALPALVRDSVLLYVWDSDSQYVYDIGQSSSHLLYTKSIELDSNSGFSLDFKIDRNGCFHSLVLKTIGEEIDEKELEEDTPVVENNLVYSSQCTESKTSVIRLPADLAGYKFTQEASIALDTSGGVHIAAIIQPKPPSTAEEPRRFWEQSYVTPQMARRLYHITMEGDSSRFQPVFGQ